MFGGGSIQLARVFGIRIGVDVSWFLVLFLIIFSLTDYFDGRFPDSGTKPFVLATIAALLFFASILLHELGHAVVAMRNGIPIEGIDLWLFGGVAKLGRDTDSPGVEFRVAVAGPLVTLAIAAVCYFGAAAIGGGTEAVDAATFADGRFGEAVAVLGYLASINVLVLLFNLIPGFPLDGGRIARAIAWKITGDRTRATRFAAVLGRGAGVLIMVAGGYLFLRGDVIGGLWFVFIGFFLTSAAKSAAAQAQLTGRLEGLRVEDVMEADPVAVPEQLPLDQVYEDYFLRYGWPWFPVVDAQGHLVGLIVREAVEAVDEPTRQTTLAATAMARDEAQSGLRVQLEEPLEALLSREGLARLGAILAVDGEGVLRGIVTVDQVRRALRGALL